MVKKLTVLIVALVLLAFVHSVSSRNIAESWDALVTSAKKYQQITFYQAERIHYTNTSRNVTIATNETVVWELLDWASITGLYWSVTGTVESAESGIVSFDVLPWRSNLPATNYAGFVKVYEGTNLMDILVAQRVTILRSPQSYLYNYIGSTSFPWVDNESAVAALQSAYNEATNALATGLQNEESSRLSGDAALSNLLQSATNDAAAEAAARIAADAALSSSLASSTGALWSAVDAQADARADADAALSNDLAVLDEALSAESDARSTADSAVYAAVSNLTITMSGNWYNEAYFILDCDQVLVGSDPVRSWYTNDDRIWCQDVYTNYTTDYQLSQTILHNINSNEFEYASSSTNYASVNENGYVSFVADGTSTLAVTLGDYARTTNLVFSGTTAGDPATGFPYIITGVAGSARKAATDDMDTRMVAGKDKTVYSLQNHSAATYVRNTNCWMYGIDLSCVSPWNSQNSTCRAGTLISPQHIAMAAHYPLYAGTVVRFVTLTNTVVERTVAAVTNLGYDISIGYLDSPINTNEITFAKILPENWANQFPNFKWSYGFQLPGACFDKEEKALASDVSAIFGAQMVGLRIPYLTNRVEFYENKIPGDSGNPAFLVIDNCPVLLTCLYSGGGGGGPNYAYYTDIINAAMTNLGGTYTTTAINLSSYTTFNPVPPDPSD